MIQIEEPGEEMAMVDRNLPLAGDGGADDLPRTLRREREAREREARERQSSFAPEPSGYPIGDTREPFRDEPQAAVVTAVRMPFFKLMIFFLKAVVAAIPALILLGAILWGMGQVLTAYFPWILKMKILITFPN